MPAKKKTNLFIGAAVLFAIAALLLTLTTREPGDQRQWFGLWRTRDLVLPLLSGWLGLALVISALGRTLLFRFISVHFAIGFCWLVLEIIGITGLVSYPGLIRGENTHPLGTQPQAEIQVNGVTYPDISMKWGLPAEPVEFDYQTNALGYRNVPGRTDGEIILLGDSILVAALLPFEQTVSARLEKSLGVPVLNISLIGKSIQEEVKLLESSGLNLRGKKVIHFVFEGNDLIDSRDYRHDTGTVREYSLLERTLVNNLVVVAQKDTSRHPHADIRTGKLQGRPVYFRYVPSSEFSLEDQREEIPHIQKSLNEARELITGQGGEYGIVFVPCKYTALAPLCEWPEKSDIQDPSRHQNLLKEVILEWTHQHNIPLLDFTPAFTQSARLGKLPFFPADTHPNGTGHEVMSEAISNWPFMRSSS